MREPNCGAGASLSIRGLPAASDSRTTFVPYWRPTLPITVSYVDRLTPLVVCPIWHPDPEQDAWNIGSTSALKLTSSTGSLRGKSRNVSLLHPDPDEKIINAVKMRTARVATKVANLLNIKLLIWMRINEGSVVSPRIVPY